MVCSWRSWMRISIWAHFIKSEQRNESNFLETFSKNFGRRERQWINLSGVFAWNSITRIKVTAKIVRANNNLFAANMFTHSLYAYAKSPLFVRIPCVSITRFVLPSWCSSKLRYACLVYTLVYDAFGGIAILIHSHFLLFRMVVDVTCTINIYIYVMYQ